MSWSNTPMVDKARSGVSDGAFLMATGEYHQALLIRRRRPSRQLHHRRCFLQTKAGRGLGPIQEATGPLRVYKDLHAVHRPSKHLH